MGDHDIGFLPEEYLAQLDADEAEKKRRIQERLKHIKLSNRGMNRVPKFVLEVEDVQSIDLGYNKLTVLPSNLTLSCFATLKSLVLWNNLLVSLPPEIVRCTNLTDLKLGNNHLPNLPEHLGRLTSLNKLDVSGNRIAIVPSTLSHLVDLTLLNFSRNSLTKYPDDQLWTLTNLTELYLGSNQLTELPLAAACLFNLRVLNVSGNRIIEVEPDAVKLPKLQELYLADNSIRQLPGQCWRHATNLTVLDLGANALTNLPHQLGYVTSITNLGVSRNPNLAPRLVTAMSSGITDLLEYLRNIAPEYEMEEDHVSAIKRMHEERKNRRKQAVEALVSGNSGANDGVERFYRELLALSLEGEDDAVREAKERLAKRMLTNKQQ
mmetsp:Transcript_27725/g.54201  ORF Transcript_27725/g.54201 Transcript_27725/m.54201 type:complete len:379 (+) Transcript_27725:54-1190(+)